MKPFVYQKNELIIVEKQCLKECLVIFALYNKKNISLSTEKTISSQKKSPL